MRQLLFPTNDVIAGIIKRPRKELSDGLIRQWFAEGKTDQEMAAAAGQAGFARVDTGYILARRRALRLLRPKGAKPGPRVARGGPVKRHEAFAIEGRSVSMPPVDHPALADGRTIYPSTVVPVEGLSNLLVSGVNSRKIGGVITKGPAKGFQVFTLTLQERATCPSSCRHWRSCVVPGTRVLTADLRWQVIETLQIGQRIVGFDEHSDVNNKRKTSIATVEKLGETVLPCFEIITDRGAITASGDHQWIARPGRRREAIDPNYKYRWRTTDELEPGDVIQFFMEPWEQDVSYDAGRLRGFLEGEGCVSTWGNNGFPKTRVQWSQLPGKLLDEINEIVRSKGYEFKARKCTGGVNGSEVMLTELLGGWREAARFLGRIRPSRLMEKAEQVVENHDLAHGNATPAKIISIRPVGDRKVVEIKTSTRTMITEGLMSHNCYGNHMHLAKRVQHGPEFEARLEAELAVLQSRHPRGFAVRLHILGDFHSVEYVRLWARFLRKFRSLFVFGFSARWERDDPIAVELVKLVMAEWGRFSIRFSNAPVDECSTVSIEHPKQKPADAIICPAQLGQTDSCSTCGLCWHTKKRIAFLQH